MSAEDPHDHRNDKTQKGLLAVGRPQETAGTCPRARRVYRFI